MADVLLEVKHVKKYFHTPKGLLHAVDDVSFSIERGKTLGVVGESGCGKSTTGRVVLRLLEPTEGSILMEGQDIAGLSESQMRSKNRVLELMETVGLARRYYSTYPHELDGGRRQRIGIARALSMNPKFIVCDEPVSALDVSIQAQILNLLEDLQKQMGLTYMFITHDLSVVHHFSDNIAVMYLGRIIEMAPSDELFAHPTHPYTQALLSAIPVPSLENRRERIILKGEITSPINLPKACRFASRCLYATERCFGEEPELTEIAPGHQVACFRQDKADAKTV